MKILFLTPWYPDDERKNHGVFIREQVLAIASKHESVVISSKINYLKFGFASAQITQSTYQSVTEYRLVICRSFPIYNQINYFLISTWKAVKVARDFKPDIVHGNIGYPGGLWSWLVSKWIGRPFVITEHTFIYNNFRSYFHRKLTLFSLQNATSVITVSTKAAAEIKKYLEKEVQVVSNIIQAERFSIQSYPMGQVVIGFLGGLSSPNHVKGLDTFLRVMSTIDKDFVLHIGGEGTMLEQYRSMASQLGIADRCRFFGFIPNNEVPIFMSKLHFFVNSSRFESFGIAIIEAMASGLPVVCFDNGGPGDFVNSSNGYLIADQDEEKLKNGIEKMIDNYKNFDREKIRNFIKDKFSREQFVDQMDLIYMKVNHSI